MSGDVGCGRWIVECISIEFQQGPHMFAVQLHQKKYGWNMKDQDNPFEEKILKTSGSSCIHF